MALPALPLQGQLLRGGWVVGAIEKKRMALPGHGLQAAAPTGLGKSSPDGGLIQVPSQRPQSLQRSTGHGGVAALPVSRQPQSPVGGKRINPLQIGVVGPAGLLQHRPHRRRLIRADHPCSWCDHSGLLRGDGRQGGSQVFTVVEADAGHGDHRSLGMGGGGIQPTPQSHLQHQQLHRLGVKVRQGCGEQLLEGGELMLRVELLLGYQQLAEMAFADGDAINRDPLTPAHQVGGGGDAAAEACLLQRCAEKAGNRALAVGSGHLNRGNVFTRRPQGLKGMAHSAELQVHAPQIKARDQIR